MTKKSPFILSRNRRDSVAIGDIVRWPINTESDGLALVVAVDKLRGWHVLTVAPGVADVSQPVRPGTLRLTHIDEIHESGLNRAIRFELDRRISVTPSNAAFGSGEVSAIVGRLSESALKRLHTERARIHALRDIATARREERQHHHCAEGEGDHRTGWHPIGRAGAQIEEDRAC